jgi:hypothetical protein
MNEYERRLGESLKAVGEEFRPDDLGAAQREFMTRRKRRFTWQVIGGVAVAGAAVVAILLLASSPTFVDEGIPVQHEPPGTVAIEVGDEPSAVVATFTSGIWVANSGDGTVTHISTENNDTTTIDVGGHPDEIVAGLDGVYVSDAANGSLSLIDPESMQRTEVFSLGVEGRLDIAIGEGALFVASADTGRVWRLEPPKYTDPFPFDREGELFADVTGDEDEAWALGPSGDIRQLDMAKHTNDNRATAPLKAREGGPNSDLLIAGETLWTSGSGKVGFFDLSTGDFSGIAVEGDYADLSFDGTSVWALAGRDGKGEGLLYRFGLNGDQMGDPIQIDGAPVDVSVLGGSAWVVQADANTVTRIPTAFPMPVPSESSSPPEEASNNKAKSIVMVFSKDGDIYAAYGDGTIEALTTTKAHEFGVTFVDNTFNPTYPAVVFERSADGSGPQLVYLDLKTMEEQPIAPGASPTCAGGICAWQDVTSLESHLRVGGLFSEPSMSFSVPGASGDPAGIEGVAWDADGRLVYAQAVADPLRIVKLDSVEAPHEAGEFVSPDGRAFYALASSAGAGSVDVLTTTSDGTAMEIGTVSGWDNNSPRYAPLVDLSGLPFSPRSSLYELTRADGLSATPNQDGTVTWGSGDWAGWIVSDHGRAVLVDVNGGVQELPFEVHDGMDVYENRFLG